MAKRRIIRHEGEEEEVEEEKKKPAFKPPEFDETEFLQTENRSAKLIYISLAVALVAGIVTYGLMTLLHSMDVEAKFTIPIVVPFLFIGVAVFIFGKFGIDVKNLEWKKWLENGFMYFVAWFAVWLVSMNPPFSDFAEPQISETFIEINLESGKVVNYVGDEMFINDNVTTFQSMEDLEGVVNISIYATITDNWKLDSKDVTFEFKNRTGSWTILEEGGPTPVFVGKIKEVIDPTKRVNKVLDEEWLTSDDKVRSENLFKVRMEIGNETESWFIDHLKDGMSLRITFSAEDSKGNEAEKIFDFRLQI